MTSTPSVRDALVEHLERRIAALTDGRDDAVHSSHWTRLADVVAGMTAVVPGWAAGPVLGLGPAERAGWYRLTGDTLTAVRPARDCVVRPGATTCQRPHDHWEPISDAALDLAA